MRRIHETFKRIQKKNSQELTVTHAQEEIFQILYDETIKKNRN